MDDDIFEPEDEDIETPFLDLLFDDELEYEQRDLDDDEDDIGGFGIPVW